MRHWLLTYTFAADYFERRPALRPAHLAHAWAAAERGELVLGGPIEGFEEAALLFAADSAAAAEGFARSDPYVTGGLVTGWRLREWLTVVGESAASPVREA